MEILHLKTINPILNLINLSDIELVVYDFDGVMTNNLVYISENGAETVVCNRSDGLAISLIKKCGVHQIILSSEKNNVVKHRAKKLGIEVLHGIEDKKQKLLEFCSTKNYKLDKVVFIGNDLNDLHIMKLIGFPICPSDACEEVKSICKVITNASGGNGVIREFLDILRINK